MSGLFVEDREVAELTHVHDTEGLTDRGAWTGREEERRGEMRRDEKRVSACRGFQVIIITRNVMQ
jgi:hypothetical protein